MAAAVAPQAEPVKVILAASCGGEFTVVADVAEQPVTLLLTVTVYVVADRPVLVAVVALLLQLYVRLLPVAVAVALPSLKP